MKTDELQEMIIAALENEDLTVEELYAKLKLNPRIKDANVSYAVFYQIVAAMVLRGKISKQHVTEVI